MRPIQATGERPPSSTHSDSRRRTGGFCRAHCSADPGMHPVVKVATDVWGMKYEVRCSLRSPDARNPCVRSIWAIDATNADPRLVTAYGYPWSSVSMEQLLSGPSHGGPATQRGASTIGAALWNRCTRRQAGIRPSLASACNHAHPSDRERSDLVTRTYPAASSAPSMRPQPRIEPLLQLRQIVVPEPGIDLHRGAQVLRIARGRRL